MSPYVRDASTVAEMQRSIANLASLDLGLVALALLAAGFDRTTVDRLAARAAANERRRRAAKAAQKELAA